MDRKDQFRHYAYVLRTAADNYNAQVTQLTQLEMLLTEAMLAEGSQHKQWYLWKIAEALGIKITDIEDKGIAP